MRLLPLLLFFASLSSSLSLKMIVEDLQRDEAATILMLNAERTQRQFVVPLFLSPTLTMKARNVATGKHLSIIIKS